MKVVVMRSVEQNDDPDKSPVGAGFRETKLPLSEFGSRQLELMAHTIKSAGLTIDCIFAGDLSGAMVTAAALAQELKCEVEPSYDLSISNNPVGSIRERANPLHLWDGHAALIIPSNELLDELVIDLAAINRDPRYLFCMRHTNSALQLLPSGKFVAGQLGSSTDLPQHFLISVDRYLPHKPGQWRSTRLGVVSPAGEFAHWTWRDDVLKDAMPLLVANYEAGKDTVFAARVAGDMGTRQKIELSRLEGSSVEATLSQLFPQIDRAHTPDLGPGI